MVLDAQPLIASGWPTPNATFKEVALHAAATGVEIWLPEGALAECRGKARTNANEGLSRLANAVRDLQRLGYKPEVASLPDLNEHLALWDSASNAAASELALTVIPYPERPVRFFFEAAVDRKGPFNDKGVGFRDAVILASAVDAMTREGITFVWVVTANKRDFSDHRWLVEERQLRIEVLTIEEAAERLREYALEDYGADLAWRAEKARLAVDAAKDKLLAFCKAQLVVGPTDLDVPGVLIRFDVLSVAAVSQVHLSNPKEVREGERTEAGAVVRLKLAVTYRPFEKSSTVMRAGQDYDELLQHQALQEMLSGDDVTRPGWRGAVSHELNAWVTVDLTLERTASGFGAPSFISAKAVDMVGRLVLGLTAEA